MLYSQGFRQAEKLASKIVPFFQWVHTFIEYQNKQIIQQNKV
jgi:hypothetical protein